MNDLERSNIEQGATSLSRVGDDRRNIGTGSGSMPCPLFMLAPPRSHSATACAMLGQHPQMYGLPETHLFSAPTMAKWWEMCSRSTFHMEHGLLRAVAQLYFGEQSDTSIKAAEGWLRRRSHFTTGFLFEVMTEWVSPLVLVERSPTLISRAESLQRAFRMFPQARFIHVVQHPRGYGESLMQGIREAATRGPVPYWMLYLASFPRRFASEDGASHRDSGLDPQRAWYVLNTNVCNFLELVPDEQKMLLRVEDLLSDTDRTLRQIAGSLGLRTDDEAIEAMKHPERCAYARFGPPSARYGNGSFFLQLPDLGPKQPEVHTLDGPLNWRPTAQEFLPEVKELARQFGYQ